MVLAVIRCCESKMKEANGVVNVLSLSDLLFVLSFVLFYLLPCFFFIFIFNSLKKKKMKFKDNVSLLEVSFLRLWSSETELN